MDTRQTDTDRLDRAFVNALDNELAEGLDPETARATVLDRAGIYADSLGVDEAAFRAYVYAIVVGEPMGWTCNHCHTGNGKADRKCVNCNRRR